MFVGFLGSALVRRLSLVTQRDRCVRIGGILVGQGRASEFSVTVRPGNRTLVAAVLGTTGRESAEKSTSKECREKFPLMAHGGIVHERVAHFRLSASRWADIPGKSHHDVPIPAPLPLDSEMDMGEKATVMGKPDPYLCHWADHAATRTLNDNADADPIVVAAGITPSGVVHIGNFREVITVDLVARALRDKGAKVRFIYSWDDFDVFRKVPADMPQPEMLKEKLRLSIADVPDPFGEHDSYASHNIASFEHSIDPLGIAPEFIRQSRRYRAGDYAAGIRRALEGRETIKAILDQHRSQPLADDWLPLAGFCDACGKDELDFQWPGEWEVQYRCRTCEHEATVDLREGGNIKLPWRVDWPMRWAEEKVLFEPGGKDHSSAGGSYDTGREIADKVYDWKAPQYVAYDFVSIKGKGGKISSSAGGAVTVSDCLEIYEPRMLRWIFASYRPNTEFKISFDLDVLKLYEDYDRAMRLAHQAEDGSKNDKKRQMARRAMDLSSPDPSLRIEAGTPPPFQPSFRPLSMYLQIYDGDIERARQHYEATGELETEQEKTLFEQRARCVWNWIDRYAPEEFCYRIRKEPTKRVLSDDEAAALGRLVEVLSNTEEGDEKALVGGIKGVFEESPLTPQELFPVVYDLLIARPKGPKLSTLLTALGFANAIPLFSASLDR